VALDGGRKPARPYPVVPRRSNANVLAGHPHVLCARVAQPGAFPMLDILMLALGLGFFALAIGYTYACERL